MAPSAGKVHMTPQEQAQLENWFTYHPPTDSQRELREAVMTANASVACAKTSG